MFVIGRDGEPLSVMAPVHPMLDSGGRADQGDHARVGARQVASKMVSRAGRPRGAESEGRLVSSVLCRFEVLL